ncbi:tripartite tricarboxylate transporter TctB family protein [Intrasporangium mesophilum]
MTSPQQHPVRPGPVTSGAPVPPDRLPPDRLPPDRLPPDRLPPDDAVEKQKHGYAEYGVVVVLLALGAWAIVDALSLADIAMNRGPVSSKTVPIVVGILLLVTGVLLALDIARGGRGEQEGGEDVDLSQGSDWRTIGLLTASFAANAVLIERVGWPISGAVLFFGTSYALGSRHYLRNAVISLVMSVSTWYLFYAVLDLKLPAGLLKGIL